MARKRIMPEVPDSQPPESTTPTVSPSQSSVGPTPSNEEAKLTNSIPQPSEADLDKQLVQEQADGNVVPVEPQEGLNGENTQESPYKEGDSFSFNAPSGESYSILVTKVEGDQVTLQNSAPDAAPITLPLEEARKILESDARSR